MIVKTPSTKKSETPEIGSTRIQLDRFRSSLLLRSSFDEKIIKPPPLSLIVFTFLIDNRPCSTHACVYTYECIIINVHRTGIQASA